MMAERDQMKTTVPLGEAPSLLQTATELENDKPESTEEANEKRVYSFGVGSSYCL